MQTIAMVKVFPPENDTTKMMASDTTHMDSTRNRNPGYVSMANNDQLVYDDLFGSYLVKKNQKKGPKENPSAENKISKDTVQAGEENEGRKKSIFNIFRKKGKENTGAENNVKKENENTPENKPVSTPSAPVNKSPANKPLTPPPPKTIPADSTQQDEGF